MKSKFDLSDYLDNDEVLWEYLNTVLKEGTSEEIITALGHVAKSIGMTKIACQTGLSRPSLYKALSTESKPQFDTILRVIRAIGLELKI